MPKTLIQVFTEHGLLEGDCTLNLDDTDTEETNKMAHDWIFKNPAPNTPYWKYHGCLDLRECSRCGAIQEKHSNSAWMRITGYYWYPKVGRCFADQKDWGGTLHKTAIKENHETNNDQNAR